MNSCWTAISLSRKGPNKPNRPTRHTPTFHFNELNSFITLKNSNSNLKSIVSLFSLFANDAVHPLQTQHATQQTKAPWSLLERPRFQIKCLMFISHTLSPGRPVCPGGPPTPSNPGGPLRPLNLRLPGGPGGPCKSTQAEAGWVGGWVVPFGYIHNDR